MRWLRETKISRKIKILLQHGYRFLVYIKKEYIYEDNAKDVEVRFDTSNYELERPLPKGIKK